MERINYGVWQYVVNCRPFATLREAKRYAEQVEATEICLMRGTNEQLLYQYHPMSERLERVQTIAQAKAKLTK